MVEINKAPMWKRFSAFLIDGIIAISIFLGVTLLINKITNVDYYKETYLTYREHFYEENKDLIDNASTTEDYNKINNLYGIYYLDNPEMKESYLNELRYTLLSWSVGSVVAVTLVEFVAPIIMKNGQSVGKKIFKIGVIKKNGVRFNNVNLLIRGILGKLTVETLIPVILIYSFIYTSNVLLSALTIFLIIIGELILLFATKNKTFFHDLIGSSVVIDLSNQKIYESIKEIENLETETTNK